MGAPLLIDTDMGIDDAAAVCLALTAEAFDVRAIVGVDGGLGLDRTMTNIGRLLSALGPPAMPVIGRGLDRATGGSTDRRSTMGDDGFGDSDLPGEALIDADFREVYNTAIAAADGDLTILAIGPLTNLAAILRDVPESAGAIKHLYVSGGAVFAPGNIDGKAEFNFHRDPTAAAEVMASSIPTTVAPLDVTSQVSLDESHVAHLAASGYRTGEVLARLLSGPIDRGLGPERGRFQVHDAVAAASLVWPGLFMRTRMRLEIATDGADAGRSKPGIGGDKAAHVDLLTAVNTVDLLENLLEALCHEAFVV